MVEQAERHLAKQNGKPRYFTGRPCKAGHVADRRTGNGECIACAYERQKKFRADNPEAARAKDARHRAAKYAIVLERTRSWRNRNRAKIAAYNKARRQLCPEKFLPYASKRRAKMRAIPGAFSHDDVGRIHKQQRGRCAGCRAKLGSKFTRDHIIPLALGGTNFPSNIQLLCQPCNSSKNAKHPIKWAQDRGLLL